MDFLQYCSSKSNLDTGIVSRMLGITMNWVFWPKSHPKLASRYIYGVVLVRNNQAQKCLEMLLLSHYRNFKIFNLMEFLLTAVKAIGLIFSLLNVATGAFWHTTVYTSWTYLCAHHFSLIGHMVSSVSDIYNHLYFL